MKYSIILSFALVFGVIINSTAQESLSLEDAVALGLQSNFDIQVAQLQTDIASNNNSWGQTSAMPSVVLNGSYNVNITDNSQNPTSFIQARLRSDGVQYGANLNWTLFDGFGMFATKRQLELIEAQSEGNAQLVIENVVQGIVLAYYEALVQQEKLDVLQEVIALSRDRLEYMEVKKELGASTTFEILQFENAIITDSSSYLLQELAMRNAVRNLNLLMGQEQGRDWELSGTLNAPEGGYDYAALRSETVNLNRQLKNVVINKLISEQNTRIAQSGMYPVIGFNAGGNQSQNNFEAGELSGSGQTLNYFGTFTLNFNLFNGGRTRRAIQNAKINEEIAMLSQQDLEYEVESQLRNAFELYQAQEKIYALTETNTSNQKQALDIAEERFRTGAINSFDYRTQQVAYLNSSISRLEALQNLLGTNTTLTRLRGGLVK